MAATDFLIIRMETRDKHSIAELAARDGRSMSQLVRDLIDQYRQELQTT